MQESFIYGSQADHRIGDWVKALESFYFVYDMTDFISHVEYM